MNTTAERVQGLIGEGKLPDAIRLLDEAITLGETSELWNDWATAQHQLGDHRASERGYRRALKLKSSDRDAAVNLGLLLLSLGRAEEAVPLLDRHGDVLTLQERAAIGELVKRSATLGDNLGTAVSAVNLGIHDAHGPNHLPGRPKLSIVMPSHRTDLAACARILDACSCSSEDVEVVIRDNSGNREKHKLLSHISRENCRVLPVEQCDSLENNLETLALAQGEFVFFVADDDVLPRKAIGHLAELVARHAWDKSIAGITGDYVIESVNGTRFFRYPRLDGAVASDRIRAYLYDIGSNAINYSAVRTSTVTSVASFCRTMPLWFSFTDQLVAFMYLCSGKFISVNRLLYQYDTFNWDTTEKALQSDLQYFRRCGLDGSTLRMMWLIAAIEGARIVLDKLDLPDIPRADRELIALQWVQVMYSRFLGTMGQTDTSSRFDRQAIALCNKWKPPAQFHLDLLLADISEFMSLSSRDTAERYFKFWKN